MFDAGRSMLMGTYSGNKGKNINWFQDNTEIYAALIDAYLYTFNQYDDDTIPMRARQAFLTEARVTSNGYVPYTEEGTGVQRRIYTINPVKFDNIDRSHLYRKASAVIFYARFPDVNNGQQVPLSYHGFPFSDQCYLLAQKDSDSPPPGGEYVELIWDGGVIFDL
jgi:hypothetical protein